MPTDSNAQEAQLASSRLLTKLPAQVGLGVDLSITVQTRVKCTHPAESKGREKGQSALLETHRVFPKESLAPAPRKVAVPPLH